MDIGNVCVHTHNHTHTNTHTHGYMDSLCVGNCYRLVLYTSRSYLSKRDLDAHMAYRHNTMTANQQPAPMVPAPPAFFPFPPGLPPPPLPPAPGIPPLQPQRLPPPTDPSHIMR